MEQERRRPGWVWAITIFYLISIAFTAFGWYALSSHMVPVPPAQQAYFASLTPVDYAVTAAIVLCNAAGAVSLFLLRKIAAPLFAAALGINLLQTVWHVLTKGWVQAIGSSGLAGSVLGTALAVAIILYAYRLKRRGVLQ